MSTKSTPASLNSYVSVDLDDYDCNVLTPKAKGTYKQWQMDYDDALLIDGYMRQTCNVQLSSFPNEIQKIVRLFVAQSTTIYKKKYSKSELKTLIDSHEAQEANIKYQHDFFYRQYITPCFIGSLYIGILAIASLCTVYIVENDACADGDYSMLDPHYFLFVGGVALSCHVALNAVLTLIFRKDYCWNENEPKAYCYLGCACLMVTFYLVWSVLGFVIYVEESSAECKESHIGKMLLAWNIIIVVPVAFIVCCPICFLIWFFTSFNPD
eukprot:629804_1